MGNPKIILSKLGVFFKQIYLYLLIAIMICIGILLLIKKKTTIVDRPNKPTAELKEIDRRLKEIEKARPKLSDLPDDVDANIIAIQNMLKRFNQ